MEPAFSPVPVRARRDGWTPERQSAFLAALAATRCIAAAARAVGKSRRAAYLLRERPGADGFRAAWDAALAPPPARHGGRAIDGIAIPVIYRGERIGERRRFDNRLAMTLLRRRRPERFGRHLDPSPSGWDLFVAEATGLCGTDPAAPPRAPYREDRILPPGEAAADAVGTSALDRGAADSYIGPRDGRSPP